MINKFKNFLKNTSYKTWIKWLIVILFSILLALICAGLVILCIKIISVIIEVIKMIPYL